MTAAPALRISGISKRYRKLQSKGGRLRDLFRGGRKENWFWALKDVSFEVARGEAIGIVGRNGAGKSTLLKVISRITTPTEGQVELYGSVNSLLEVGTGFQPDLSGRANIFLNASILGMSRAETEEVFDQIVEFSGLKEFIDMPVKHYSSGMYSRLAFSIAANVSGDILAVDEVLAVGDAEFRRKCLQRMDAMLGARTVLFVSHSMDAILRFCSKAVWIDHGSVRAYGPAADVVQEYLGSVSDMRSSLVSSAGLDEHAEDLGRCGGSAGSAPAAPPLLPGQMARILSATVVDDHYQRRELYFSDEPVHVEMEFEVVEPGLRLMSYFALRCAPRKGVVDDIVVFSDHSDAVALDKGVYVHRATIPADLLISSVYGISVALMSPGSPLTTHHLLKRVLSFRVAERTDSGLIVGENLRGVIRPRIAWTAAELRTVSAVPDTA